VSRFATNLDDDKMRLVLALSQVTGPSHAFASTPRGCEQCPDLSPFRWNESAHPYVIEEEPS